MEWISVKERMPEYGKNVLILFNDNDIRIANLGCDMGGNDKWDKVPSWIGCGYYFLEDVTHWMPLPKPPE